MSTGALYIKHKALPGKRDGLRRVWEKYARPYIEKSEGQLACFYCYDDKDPDTVVVFSVHADQDSAEDFFKQPWYADYQSETAALLAGPSEIRPATPQWVKGLSR